GGQWAMAQDPRLNSGHAMRNPIDTFLKRHRTTDTDLHPVIRAMRGRRSIGRVHPERPPRDLIEHIIAAAGWAPNHYRTEPWRFVVIAGEARERLGDLLAESERARLDDPE